MLAYREWYVARTNQIVLSVCISHQSDRRIRVCISHQSERRFWFFGLRGFKFQRSNDGFERFANGIIF